MFRRLADVAERTGCAVILIGHLNKAAGGQSAYRGLGSIDFRAAARSVLLIGRVKREPNVRVIVHDKSSLAPGWGNAEDIKPYIDPVFENNILLTQTERLTMNSRPKQPKYARNKNILVIGGSGSGKTRFFVKPSLMQCTKDFPTSYVVTDPKGTVLEIRENVTAGEIPYQSAEYD